MKVATILAAIAASTVIVGCQSTDQMLDKQQQQAVDTALQRARFEMNCPGATAQVLSREMVQPAAVRFGVERAEYTVGIEGCGQRTSMVVVCPMDGGGCFAGGPRQ